MSLSQSFAQKIGNVRPLNPCPSLDIDFVNGGYVNNLGFANQASVGSANFNIGSFNGADPVFTRASAATFRGSNGLIQYAPENLLLNSEDFTSWLKPTIGVSSNVAISPAGTTTADLIYPGSSGSAREIFVNFTYTGGLSYTASVYVKYAGKQWITLGTNNGTVANRCAWFDILNGVKGQVATGYQSEIESIGNGWYRLKVVISGSTSPYFDISIVDADGGGSVTKNGTDGAYIWGAQLERASAARPYISTTSQPRYGPRFEYDLNGNPLGLLMEEQSRNLVYPSATLATQTRTVTAAPHTLSFYGTGSVVLSGTHSATVTGTSASTRTVYTFTPTAGSLTLTVSGSVTSAQLEDKPFATSYIPTVGGSVTRSADTVNSTIGSWYNTDEGTIVVGGDRNNDVQDSFFEFTSGTTACLTHIGNNPFIEEIFAAEDSAVTLPSSSGGEVGTFFKFAGSYSLTTGAMDVAVNGDAPSGTGDGTLLSLTTPTTLNIGYSPEVTKYWNGHIKTFRYYPKALPSKLAAFTA